MALTNRHRLSILIGFLVISEIFYITLMIKIPDDIMEREKAQNFVEQVGKYIPKIANLQKLAERDVVPEVMPFFYAVVSLWCLSVGLLVTIIFRGFRLRFVKRPENRKQFYAYIGLGVMVIIFFIDDIMFKPPDPIYRSKHGELFYVYRGTTAFIGAMYATIIYLNFMYLFLNVKNYVLFITSKGKSHE